MYPHLAFIHHESEQSFILWFLKFLKIYSCSLLIQAIKVQILIFYLVYGIMRNKNWFRKNNLIYQILMGSALFNVSLCQIKNKSCLSSFCIIDNQCMNLFFKINIEFCTLNKFLVLKLRCHCLKFTDLYLLHYAQDSKLAVVSRILQL